MRARGTTSTARVCATGSQHGCSGIGVAGSVETEAAVRSRTNPLRLMSLSLRRTELAAYSAGMNRNCYLVARLRWCLDGSVCEELSGLLRHAAARVAQREGWPEDPRVSCHACRNHLSGSQYREQLAGLAIAEMYEPHRWRNSQARGAWFGCSGRTWARRHSKNYGLVWGILYIWLDTAFGMMKKAQFDPA